MFGIVGEEIATLQRQVESLKRDLEVAWQNNQILEKDRQKAREEAKAATLRAEAEMIAKNDAQQGAEHYHNLVQMIERGCYQLHYFDTDKDSWEKVSLDSALQKAAPNAQVDASSLGVCPCCGEATYKEQAPTDMPYGTFGNGS